MAHVWNTDEAGCWVATPVGDALPLVNDAVKIVAAGHAAAATLEHAYLRRLAGALEAWAIVCPPQSDVRVNGERVPLGLAILSDRDELRVPGQPVRFFSTETIAHVEAFPEDAGGYCPRCKQPIEPESAVVRCPGCGLWHHASDDLPCWSYSTTCAGCAHATAMDAGFKWTPEDP
jgi:hypothetical protein